MALISNILLNLWKVYLIGVKEMFGRFFLFWKSIPMFDDKAIFITGCDSGFGHLMALDFNNLGFTIFAGCLFPDAENSKSLLTKAKHSEKMIIIPIDVTSESSVNQAYNLINKCLNEDGIKLWTLINNAGIASVCEFEWGNFDKEFRSVLEVNTIGMALVTRKFLPLIRHCSGRVINMNSVASRFSPPGMLSYDMSKHASLAFTECLRREMYKFGVKVISVEPFFYRTNIVDKNICINAALRAWENTDASVRSDYGEKYFKRFIKLNSSEAFDKFLRDPAEVVTVVRHAVSAVHPKMSYGVTSYFWRFVLWYMACFNHPQEAEELGWNLGAAVLGLNKPIPNE